MPVAAVLGWPLSQTLSPQLHQAAYHAAGLDLEGWTYEARPTRPQDLPAALAEIRDGRLAGANLTTPHKQAAVPLLDALDPPAGTLGAVNTIYLPPCAGANGDGDARRLLTGANTDVCGVLWALDHQLGLCDTSWDGQGPALLLGSGGAALAAALAWARLTAARQHGGLPTSPLLVAARDPAKAAQVATHAGPGGRVVAWDEVAGFVPSARVLLQATTLTAQGHPIPGQDHLPPGPGLRVLDLNYGPGAQGLVTAARAAGATVAADGLGMLCAQAAAAVTLIARISPDLDAMAAAVGLRRGERRGR